LRVPALKPSSSPARQSQPRAKYGIGEPRKNFLKIPREYFQLAKEKKLSGLMQSTMLLLIMQNTWGAKGRPEYAPISLKTFSEECGDASRGAVCRDLQDMELRGLIESKTGPGCKGLKLYKVTQSKWRDAPMYVADIETAADVEDNFEDDEPQTDGRVVVRPNADPSFVSRRLALKDREPVDFRIAYTSSFAQPLAISSSVTDDVVTIHLHGAGKANIKASTGLYRDPIQKAKTEAVERLESFDRAISVTQTSLFDRPFDSTVPADKKFLRSILAAAGDTLPAAYFETFVREEIQAMVRRRKSIYPGILISLAAQAARKFAASQCNFAPASPSDAAPLPDLVAELAAGEEHCNVCTGRIGDRTCTVCDGTGKTRRAKVATC
jgi:hypothetical protein